MVIWYFIGLIVARIPVNSLDGDWRAAEMEEQPRPVIVDPLRRAHLPKLLHLVSLNQAKPPWIFCREDTADMDDRCIPLKTHHGRFAWTDILSALYSRGVKSVMIEGGANVINDILTHGMADIIIITIAPVFIGRDSVGVGASVHEEWLHDVHSLSVGRDMVIAGRFHKDKQKS